MLQELLSRLPHRLFKPLPLYFYEVGNMGFRKLRSRAKARQGGGFCPSLVPAIMALEDRILLSGLIVTNTLGDGSNGSLAWAVGQANSTSGVDTITFDPTLFATPQTITLTAGQLELTDSAATTITGPAAALIVSGNNASRVFQVDSGATATLSGLTISGGFATGYGGGVQNDGTVLIVDCTFEGNSALYGGGVANTGTATITGGVFRYNTAGGNGGGIDNVGTLSVFDTLFVGNTASSYGGTINTFGGVAGFPGTTLLEGCTFNNNTSGFVAGAVQISETTGTVIDCTFEGNSAVYGGGLSNSGTTTIAGSVFLDNTAFGNGGGIENIGTISVNDVLFESNYAGFAGGGFHTYGGFSGLPGTTAIADSTFLGNSAGYSGGGIQIDLATATISGSLLSGNSAYYYGGGLDNTYGAVMTLTNCTVSSNSTYYYDGGGLYNAYGAVLTLTNCTVYGNSTGYYGNGGGLFNYYGTATLTNSIVAGNTNLYGASDIGAYYLVSGSHNLIGTGGSGGLFNGVDGNIVGVANPLLAPLGDYGGPTKTMPLLPGSPAIDAGTGGIGIPATDQRGMSRFGGVDIGAFESQGFSLTLVAGSTPQTADIGTAFANPLAVAVTANNPVEPVDGGIIGFVAHPAINGATAILLDTTANIDNGQAAITAAPNNVLGSYTVDAAVPGSSASFALANAGQVFAALIVNTTSDTLFPGAGLLSLREAIAFANNDNSANSAITFDAIVFATPQTITLISGQLELSDPAETTITGPGAGLVSVSGNYASRVFQVDSGATATLTGLTILGGSAVFGGGVENDGTILITSCTLEGNSASFYGGGLYNGGSATLTNCTVNGNSSTYGGGIYNFGTATLTDCTINANSGYYGGGLYNSYGAVVTLTNCAVGSNFACYYGGGLDNDYGAVLTLTNSTVYGNSTGYYGNGGGLHNNGTATLTNCTISNNSATYGGGLFNYGTVTLTNCTVSSNSVTYGSGGGLYSDYSTATLINTIIAGNTNWNGASDINAYYGVSGSHNLIGTGGSGGLVNGVDGNIVGVANPLLAPLGDYGGPTQTMPLLPGSLAIDAGASGIGIPATDQRGMSRFGGVDIGAFESQGFSLTLVAGGSPQTADIGTAFANPLAVTVTANNPVEPVNGGIIGFVVHPAVNGAAAIFLAPSAVIDNGHVAVVAAPNNILGSYTVDAAIPGSSVAFALTNAGHVFAALVVNTTSDSLAPGAGLLSLREAVAFANTDNSAHSAITFNPIVFATPQTITLISGQFELTDPAGTTITGPGAGLLSVNGNNASRIFQIDVGTVAISGMTLTGGNATHGNGGAILNFADLTLSRDILTGNQEGPGGNGGGAVLNVGGSSHLTVDHTTISNNFASFTGGGICLIDGGTLTVFNSTITGNASARDGGGITLQNLTNSVSATVTNSIISNNTAYGGGGGGILNVSNSYSTTTTLTVKDSTIVGNTAYFGGGLANVNFQATTTLTNCTVDSNVVSYGGGGGLYNSYGTVKLTDCTIDANSGLYSGGGLANVYGTATLTNCAVHGNSVTYGNGGGLYNSGTASLTNCTANNNSAGYGGGGLYNEYGTAMLANSTVNGNSATYYGGGLYNRGTASLTNCTVNNNSAGYGGGGLYNEYGTAMLANSTVNGNSVTYYGGGLYNLDGTALLINCIVNTNFAYYGGGGLYSVFGTATLTGCTVNGNSAGNSGGGLNSNYGTATLTNCTVKNNSAAYGGGLAGFGGTLIIDSSTVINNWATFNGGGISLFSGSATITNSVINSNRVDSPDIAQGGGIYSQYSVLSLTNCTVNANQANGATAQGGGIYAYGSSVDLKKTTVNGNKANGKLLGQGGGVYGLYSFFTLLASTVNGNKATTSFDNIFYGP